MAQLLYTETTTHDGRWSIESTVGKYIISTVLLPYPWVGEYETIVFDEETTTETEDEIETCCERYESKEAAIAGHLAIVKSIQKAVSP